jgi:hypothetical protein
MRGLKKFKLNVAFGVQLPAEMPQSRTTLSLPRPSNGCGNNQNAAAPRANVAMGAFEGYRHHRKPSN